MKRLVILMFVLLPLTASAWGEDGHRIVCQIAFDELTPAASAEVNRLLALDPDFENFDESFDEISELNTNLRLKLLDNVDFLYGSNYSFNVQEFFRQVYSIVYRSKCNCWSTNLSIVDRARADDTQFRILLNLEGLGAIGNTGGTP